MSRFSLVTGRADVMARLPTVGFAGAAGLSPAAAARYTRALLSTPYGRGHLHPLAYVDTRSDEVVATALLRVTPAFVGGAPVVIGLVQDTAAAVGADGGLAGLITSLMEQSAEFAPDVSLFLVSTSGQTAIPGFTTLPTQDVTLSVRDGRRQGAPMLPIRSGERDDLDCIAALPRPTQAGLGLHLARGREALEFAITRQRLLAGLAPEGSRALRFLVVEEGMRAAAYVVMTERAGSWTLEECGDRDPTGARVGAMLQALAALTPGQPRMTLMAWLPAGFLPPQVEVTSVRPSAVRLLARTHGIALDLERLQPQDICYWHGDL